LSIPSRAPACGPALHLLAASCAAIVLAAVPVPADAQVSLVQVRKSVRYTQTSETRVALRPTASHWFQADVDGTDIGGIAPPSVAGPFNVAALGARHNNGVLVFNPVDNGWRWGADGKDFNTTSKEELDRLFPNGTYTFTVNGTSVPLALAGDAYPNAPVFTLEGGRWAGGAYVVDPSRPLTITTNRFAGYGTHRNSIICLFFRGPGYVPAGVTSITSCPLFLQRSSETPDRDFSTVTLPAGTLRANEEYTLIGSFGAITDARTVAGLPGSTNTARYLTATTVTLKTITPVFPMTVTSNITATVATVTANIQYRLQDVGGNGSIYAFAVAPAPKVKGGDDPKAMRVGWATGPDAKDDAPTACVLAQLSQAGQMVAVTADQLNAYLTGVLSAQGASVAILNGVPVITVTGSTFFVGYGSSGASMINGGVNRSVVTIPGSLTCEPGPPQTGWWWNPLEDGRGFSLEVRGNNLFFAAFLYDISGRSTWYVSTGPVSLDGSYYSGDLLSASGGQTLGGAYPGFPVLASVGPVTLAFNNASTGTLVWPGGTVPIQRFNIVPDGLNLDPVDGQPESGWWWNEQEAGRGFFMEWQGGNLDIAGYMYDEAGNSVWYLTTGPIGGTATARSFAGNWWTFADGQTLTGPWKPNRQTSSNAAPVTIQFSGPDTALMTLPNGRSTSLTRHRF